MKYKKYKNTILKLLPILIIIPMMAIVSANDIVRISTGEWIPYISETIDQNGLLAQITKEAFALQKIDMKLGFFPWERAYNLSKSSAWDGTIAVSKTTERERVYLFSDPIYTGKYVFFHLKSTRVDWKNYNDLSHFRIAALRGFGGMGQDFLTAEEKKTIAVDRVNTLLQAFNMLFLKRVQLIPSDLEVGYVYLHQNFNKKNIELVTHDKHLINQTQYHLIMPKSAVKSAGIIKKFNQGISELRKSGRYNQIITEFYKKKAHENFLPANYLTTDFSGQK